MAKVWGIPCVSVRLHDIDNRGHFAPFPMTDDDHSPYRVRKYVTITTGAKLAIEVQLHTAQMPIDNVFIGDRMRVTCFLDGSKGFSFILRKSDFGSAAGGSVWIANFTDAECSGFDRVSFKKINIGKSVQSLNREIMLTSTRWELSERGACDISSSWLGQSEGRHRLGERPPRVLWWCPASSFHYSSFFLQPACPLRPQRRSFPRERSSRHCGISSHPVSQTSHFVEDAREVDETDTDKIAGFQSSPVPITLSAPRRGPMGRISGRLMMLCLPREPSSFTVPTKRPSTVSSPLALPLPRCLPPALPTATMLAPLNLLLNPLISPLVNPLLRRPALSSSPKRASSPKKAPTPMSTTRSRRVPPLPSTLALATGRARSASSTKSLIATRTPPFHLVST